MCVLVQLLQDGVVGIIMESFCSGVTSIFSKFTVLLLS